jgi:Polysaccharide pyruvyl transferase
MDGLTRDKRSRSVPKRRTLLDVLSGWVKRRKLRSGSAPASDALAKDSKSPEVIAARRQASVAVEDGDVAKARAMHGILCRSSNPNDVAFARALSSRIKMEERAAALKLRREDRPRLWWMEQPYPGNLGDILNPYVIEKLTGMPPVMSPRGVGALVIGSVIKFAREGTKVWGAGTPRMTDELHPHADYRAVRGPLTRQLVLKSGGVCAEVYGDPAWFMPRIYNPTVAKDSALGLIRHISHADRSIKIDGVKEISVERVGDEEIEAFVRELVSCERIISTSLHGVILAHAYGIPAEWAAFLDSGKQIAGDGTKFQDYFRSVGIDEDRVPLDLTSFERIDDGLARFVTTLPYRQIDLAKLAAVSPFDVDLRRLPQES